MERRTQPQDAKLNYNMFYWDLLSCISDQGRVKLIQFHKNVAAGVVAVLMCTIDHKIDIMHRQGNNHHHHHHHPLLPKPQKQGQGVITSAKMTTHPQGQCGRTCRKKSHWSRLTGGSSLNALASALTAVTNAMWRTSSIWKHPSRPACIRTKPPSKVMELHWKWGEILLKGGKPCSWE